MEKKSLRPEYNIRPYENILAQMASYSEYEPVGEEVATFERSWTTSSRFSEGLYSEGETVGGSDMLGGDEEGGGAGEEVRGYCPNCGVGVRDLEGFLGGHLWGCLVMKVEEGMEMVGVFDAATGRRVGGGKGGV